jgi:biopolymer transport protein ExbD
MTARLDHGGDDLAEAHEINVTPFIDVMLVLLIIFMIAAPLSTVETDVDLPASNAQSQPPGKPISLTLKPDLSLIIDGEPQPREALAVALDRKSNGDKRQRIFLSADKSVPYGELMQLMNDLRAARYLKLGLVGVESDRSP